LRLEHLAGEMRAQPSAAERGGADQQAGNYGRPDQQRYRGGECRRTGFVERRLHCPSSFDQLMSIDVNAERILFQAIGVAWLLHRDGEDRGPALRRSELAVLVGALGPGHTEAVGRGADDAGDLDGDLALTDLGEGIVAARIIVQRGRTAIGRRARK
jgi:hypothetical protein